MCALENLLSLHFPSISSLVAAAAAVATRVLPPYDERRGQMVWERRHQQQQCPLDERLKQQDRKIVSHYRQRDKTEIPFSCWLWLPVGISLGKHPHRKRFRGRVSEQDARKLLVLVPGPAFPAIRVGQCRQTLEVLLCSGGEFSSGLFLHKKIVLSQ